MGNAHLSQDAPPEAPDPARWRLGYHLTELTIGQVVAAQARRLGDATYLSYLPDGRRLGYAAMHALSNRIANGLLAAGVGPGMHVGVMLDNCPEQLLLYMALGKMGAVAVPVNTAARGQLLQHYLGHADAVALVTSSALLPHAAEALGQLPAVRWVVELAEAGTPRHAAAELGQAQWLPYAQLLEAADTTPVVPVKFTDLAFLLYTSGTTGPSKAIMFTHAYALLYGIDQAENYGFRGSDVIHVCLPLFHANGLLSHCYGALVVGAQVALARRFSASAFWQQVRDSGATVLSLLGSMANILWSLPARADDADHRVRQATIAPVPSVRAEFERRYGLRILSTYGLTDYGLGAIYGPDAPASKLGSAGRARRGMQLRIVDEDDLPLPPGEVGEIVMRSDYPWNTASGYYKMPEATLASRRNLWFHTGDRGYLDADGYLFFADRKKDAIRRRGENISAFEVEQAIVSHAAVADVAVFPVATSLGEDEVAAAIVLAEGAQLAEAEVIEHCRRNLAYFMVPRYLRFVRDLPRNATHKVEKHRLQAQAQAALAQWWDREAAGGNRRP